MFNLAGCKNVLGKSLFLIGEIGGNDFTYPFALGKSLTEVKTYVAPVINAISSTISVRFLKCYATSFVFNLFFLDTKASKSLRKQGWDQNTQKPSDSLAGLPKPFPNNHPVHWVPPLSQRSHYDLHEPINQHIKSCPWKYDVAPHSNDNITYL